MRVVMFVQSLISCWNHGNAHFLRGVASELLARGHEVDVYEPEEGWSVTNLVEDHGPAALTSFVRAYPQLFSHRYRSERLDLDRVLDGADLVLVHEWNEPELVARIGRYRRRARSFRLFFHDTHHRAATAPSAMSALDLRDYDGALVFGSVLRDLYLERGWVERAWTWHEAADVRLFRPLRERPQGDVVWIGNWGDDERTAELSEFLLEPVRRLRLRARVYGVRYPDEALESLARAGVAYGGWLPNHEVPRVFARFRVTVHVPRRPYAAALPGIPTIRPFEAMACGIPLVSAPWEDSERLFEPGRDFLVARDGAEMERHLRALLSDPEMGEEISGRARRRILERHTCAHRVDELLSIHQELEGRRAAKSWSSSFTKYMGAP